MHTDHSYDCATPVEVLLAEARARGLGAIAVTDHNEISGAHDARAKADGIKVIVGEEVKTAEQGEVIGLFIEEKIPRGMTLQETIAEIKRQGGLVYVPHPFDRLHSVPDYEHLLDVLDEVDAIEVFNPRVAIAEFNDEAAAVRGQVPDPRRRRLRRARPPGARLGADPDARLRRPRGVPRVAARRRHRPQPGQPALRPGAEVPADQGAARGAAPRASARRRRAAAIARANGRDAATPDALARTSPRAVQSDSVPATDDEIREKYLERAIRELNALRARARRPARTAPGAADARARVRASAGRHLPGQVLGAALGGRGGGRVLRARRQRADEVAQAAVDRSARGLRDAVREVPGGGPGAGRPGVRRAGWSRSSRSSRRRWSW